MMCPLIFIGFLLAFAAPALYRRLGPKAGQRFALWPAAVLLYLLCVAPQIAGGTPVLNAISWVPSLDVALNFRIDGLSLLFSCMITAIGAFILIYTGAYMEGSPRLGRFYMYMIVFMVSMVGTVCADNLILIFIFWELTSISSYLLIGFNHLEEKSRDNALQALLITGGGGLALLAGFILMGIAGGSLNVENLYGMGATLRESPLYFPMLLLILLGAFTKSAQMPFHVWLPNAMVAPTPVSAYLHSSTMVQLGVFLLARLSPILGGTPAWQGIIICVGAVTMLGGALLALPQTDLKLILAYTTVSVLGLLMMLIGIGTPAALGAMCAMMLAHALYKASLFMVAGGVDHQAGTRSILNLGGLRSRMPMAATAAVLSALSMAGILPLFGFVAKECFYDSVLVSSVSVGLLLALGVAANGLLGCCAGMVCIWPFFGKFQKTPRFAHRGPLSLWIGAFVLSILSLLLGLFPGLAGWLLNSAAQATTRDPVSLHLELWSGPGLPLFLSALTLAVAAGSFLWLNRLRGAGRLRPGFTIVHGPNAFYFKTIDWLFFWAAHITRFVQCGYLRIYVMIMTGVGALVILYGLLAECVPLLRLNFADLRLYELLLAVAMIIAAIAGAKALTKLVVVVTLSVIGYGMGVVYILYGAPDLALTQLAIESLSLILLMAVLHRAHPIRSYSTRFIRVRDGIIAGAFGLAMTGIMLAGRTDHALSRLAEFFSQYSLTAAHGRNIVNVILVDFRGFDTLGETTVLGIAGLGVYALLKLRPRKREGSNASFTDS